MWKRGSRALINRWIVSSLWPSGFFALAVLVVHTLAIRVMHPLGPTSECPIVDASVVDVGSSWFSYRGCGVDRSATRAPRTDLVSRRPIAQRRPHQLLDDLRATALSC